MPFSSSQWVTTLDNTADEAAEDGAALDCILEAVEDTTLDCVLEAELAALEVFDPALETEDAALD